MVTGYYWKLTETELRALVPAADAERIMAVSRERKPGQFAERVVRVPLNGPGTVRVQNVHYYGGEHFDKPFYFPAEITCATTGSAFSRCVNRLAREGRLRGLRLPSTY